MTTIAVAMYLDLALSLSLSLFLSFFTSPLSLLCFMSTRPPVARLLDLDFTLRSDSIRAEASSFVRRESAGLRQQLVSALNAFEREASD